MPMVKEALENDDELKSIMKSMKISFHDPDHAVAKGAALYANLLAKYGAEIAEPKKQKVTQ